MKASPKIKALTIEQFDAAMAERRSKVTCQTKSIPMPAFGKARPRVTRNGTYMPAEYERQRAQLAMLFGPVEVEGLVRLSVTAVRRLPKKTQHGPGYYCTAGPDSDNILGAVMDSLFPNDDSCVIDGRCIRVWGEDDMLVIRLEAVSGDKPVSLLDRLRTEPTDTRTEAEQLEDEIAMALFD